LVKGISANRLVYCVCPLGRLSCQGKKPGLPFLKMKERGVSFSSLQLSLTTSYIDPVSPTTHKILKNNEEFLL
jgi:hypothetical protein